MKRTLFVQLLLSGMIRATQYTDEVDSQQIPSVKLITTQTIQWVDVTSGILGVIEVTSPQDLKDYYGEILNFQKSLKVS